MRTVLVATQRHLVQSLQMQSGAGRQITNSNDVLVKGATNSGSSYNVWDDDWSD